MIPHYSTPVPNILFDYYLPKLKPAELTLLLIIIRQTAGWYDPYTRKRKERDWLSGSQLRIKTGYSRKSISTAIEGLTRHELIKVFDSLGRELRTPEERQGKTHLMYAVDIPVYISIDSPTTCAKSAEDLRTMYAQQKKLLQKRMIISANK